MRLRDDKVAHLAKQLAARLLQLPEVHLLGDRQTLEHTISEAILDDLIAEEELDAEVTKLLSGALQGRSRDSVNYSELFKKAKRELAKQKRMVL